MSVPPALPVATCTGVWLQADDNVQADDTGRRPFFQRSEGPLLDSAGGRLAALETAVQVRTH
jgi:hypothetical protein